MVFVDRVAVMNGTPVTGTLQVMVITPFFHGCFSTTFVCSQISSSFINENGD